MTDKAKAAGAAGGQASEKSLTDNALASGETGALPAAPVSPTPRTDARLLWMPVLRQGKHELIEVCPIDHARTLERALAERDKLLRSALVYLEMHKDDDPSRYPGPPTKLIAEIHRKLEGEPIEADVRLKEAERRCAELEKDALTLVKYVGQSLVHDGAAWNERAAAISRIARATAPAAREGKP